MRLKPLFFNGFRVNETFTHAMLNTQEDTGDPLFMLQARQQGILENDYIYMGARASFINYQRLNHVPAGGENKQFSYNVDGYLASTISKWVSALVGFSLNSKYIYEMENAGDYQFLGLAYSNVSGFQANNGNNVRAFDVNYGLSISDINFEAEALLIDKGVRGVSNSSSVSPNNIAGVPFFWVSYS
jgi:hypothetical protein